MHASVMSSNSATDDIAVVDLEKQFSIFRRFVSSLLWNYNFAEQINRESLSFKTQAEMTLEINQTMNFVTIFGVGNASKGHAERFSSS